MLLALLGAGCTESEDAPEEAAPASPSASASPAEPTPPPIQPVKGRLGKVKKVDSSWNGQLGLPDDGEPRKQRVTTVTESLTAALDAYLDAAQRGEPPLDHLKGRWLNKAHPKAAEKLRTLITNPDNPVADARYDLQIQLEPNPTLVTAKVRVERRDGTPAHIEMIFDVTKPKKPRLQLVASRGDGS